MSVVQESPPAEAAVGTDRDKAEITRAQSDQRWFYLLIGPWLLGFIALSVVPLTIGLVVSFTNYNGLDPEAAKWVGARNYRQVLEDPVVREALGRTLVFALMFIPLNFLIGLTTALLLNARGRARGFFRALFYLPSVIPVVGAVFIWRSLWDENYGLINGLLERISPSLSSPWLAENATEVLVSLALWLGSGAAMIVYLAALQNVPGELEEAAVLDGAGYLRRLRHIVLPLLTPVIFYQLIVTVIFSLQVLVEPLLLAPGSANVEGARSVPNDNRVFMVYVYQQMFENQRFGYAAALLWMLFILAALLTAAIFLTRRLWVHSETGNL